MSMEYTSMSITSASPFILNDQKPLQRQYQVRDINYCGDIDGTKVYSQGWAPQIYLIKNYLHR